MPPRAKITKDMVVDAAFAVARKTGAEHINARTVSNELNYIRFAVEEPDLFRFLFQSGFAAHHSLLEMII